MKSDLATAIGVAILGLVISIVVTNLLVGKIENVTVRTIDSNISSEVAEPSNEVFNYRALNPTVEVYVGDCTNYNQYGECIDDDNSVNNTNTNQESQQ